jgi:site-specific recombinase XerD
VWRIVKRYAERAGLDPSRLGAHSLRVGHVTQALANGADLGSAQLQLRHRRSETTIGYNRGRSFKNNSSGKLGL